MRSAIKPTGRRIIIPFLLILLLSAGGGGAETVSGLTAEAVRERLAEFITENSPWDREEIKINITRITPPIQDDFTEITNTAYLNSPLSYSEKKEFALLISNGGGKTHKVIVSADIEISETVAVAARSIGASRIITPEDVILIQRKITSGDNLYTLDDVIGKSTRKQIKANSIIQKRFLDEPVIIEKDDKILLTYKKESVKILTIGLAREDGRLGDIIKVMNLDSQKVIYGKVEDTDTVLVNF